ncbi:class I adenylate-forming enzyme family protein [Aestuariibius sp. 2305UL40-4]|uniref:class I adenylate-forming enzyme family protein n=1 Tax=Aestuariibius violaceus TaxID=3234132 RepID=UPI00345EA53B
METICGYLDDSIARWPDAPAIRGADGRRWTYRDLGDAARAAEDMLKAEGTQPGDRVMIVAENCAEAVAFLFGATRLGAWAVPVNARQTQGEIDRIIAHAEPRAVILTTGASNDAATHADRLNARRVEDTFGQVAIAATFASAPEPDRAVAVLLYTTGTTGDPKGVMLTHANLRFAGHASATLRGMSHDDTVYGVLPMTHVFGLASMIIAATYAGATIRLEPRFSAEKLYRALMDDVTILPAVPQMHALLMQYTSDQELERLTGSGLRYVSSGAAPLDPIWKKKAESFYGIALQNGYGMTESTAGICATRHQKGDPDISVGRPLDGVEVCIDEAAQGGGDGIGEVQTRGPHVMCGYYKAPGETEKILGEGGWLHTGDLGRIDGEGRLHILGRSKELIIHGGFNVYPPEVEAALNDHPAVVQSAVIGQVADGDEQVLAFVQVGERAGVHEAELKAYVAERLAGYKRPSRIIIARSLPAAPTGKILKHRLLECFKAELGV